MSTSQPIRTGLRSGSISGTRSTELTTGWSLQRTDAGAVSSPADLTDDGAWVPAIVPGTVASSIGTDDLDGHQNYDDFDWWYRCEVPVPEAISPTDDIRLRFDGLATIAELWWNGHRVLDSANMFVAHEADVTGLVQERNELVMVFRSLTSALAVRRPRPRWKTKLVEHQRLRWFRTTLLGRIPGWTPAVRSVGPWRSIWLEASSVLRLGELNLETQLDSSTGVVTVHGTLDRVVEDIRLEGAVLRVAGAEGSLTIEPSGTGWSVEGQVRVPDARLWWPRTHGDPVLHRCELEVTTSSGPVSIDCGRVGFRSIEIDRKDSGIRFVVNGVPVFCRGACWTSNDIISLVGAPHDVRRTLELVAAANANMIRVGGTMVYETDAFYDECDRLGLMVWQDFMFANMDYPVDDPEFSASIQEEAGQQLRRLTRHPSVVAFCGGSEVEQQAAMFGAAREIWTNDFFSSALPRLVEQRTAGTLYWPSTPTGGTLPFHVGEGLAHYYGVGAYRRPVEDARLADVKFTPECLGFSNVPEPSNLRGLTPHGSPPPHHPAWKKGVPRDSGAAWDFEDIRDHYLGDIFGVDPSRLRADDPEQYRHLSRVVTGQIMSQVFDEWRSANSGCGGGLVWFLRDLRPGAGWGIIDSDNHPKAVYFFLKRAWEPQRITLLDRGLDGLLVEVHNESPQTLTGVIDLEVSDGGGTVVGRGMREIELTGHGGDSFPSEELLGHFTDPTYSYRFGPPRHAVVQASLRRPDGAVLSTATYWPKIDAALPSVALVGAGDQGSVAVSCDGLARAVRLDLKEGVPADNYFDLLAVAEYRVPVDGGGDPAPRVQGFVEALNCPLGCRLSDGA